VLLYRPTVPTGFPAGTSRDLYKMFPTCRYLDILHTRLSLKYISANGLNPCTNCTSLPQINQLLAPLEVGHEVDTVAKADSFVSLSAKEYVEEIFPLWGGRGLLSRPLAPRLS
jgi:hypothetical protein